MTTNTLARRSFCTGALVSSSVAISGCFGSFGLTKALWRVNDRIGGRFISWLLFLLFSFFQVYSVTLFIDVFILNLIEFWTGVPVLGQAPPKRQLVDADGNRFTMAVQADGSLHVAQGQEGQEVALFVLHRHTHGVHLQDLRHTQDLRARGRANGSTDLLASDGTRIASMDKAQWHKVSGLLKAGSGVQEACQRGLSPHTLAKISAFGQRQRGSDASATMQG